MIAEEIREAQQALTKGESLAKLLNCDRYCDFAAMVVNLEIAAQLAELNATLTHK